jgi:hypothetical protein
MLLLDGSCFVERLTVISSFSNLLIEATEARVLERAIWKPIETEETQKKAWKSLDYK